MPQREIKPQRAKVEILANGFSDDQLGDVHSWLCTQAQKYNLCWLLAYADDGVIWGRMDGVSLITSYEAAKGIEAEKFCTKLSNQTLQQARIFGTEAEVLLWRNSGNNCWQARLILDILDSNNANFDEAFDENYLIVGTRCKQLNKNFTLLEDGAQGLIHVVPISIKNNEYHKLKLKVRHYLAKEDFARITISRLVYLSN
ncbi:MAG: TIGR03984 family CRISPR-associated protein [Acidobacteria bacterium]|nr:TIGR03984 family CRISPR-associated protein [Acidobacteriota bacterium]